MINLHERRAFCILYKAVENFSPDTLECRGFQFTFANSLELVHSPQIVRVIENSVLIPRNSGSGLYG